MTNRIHLVRLSRRGITQVCVLLLLLCNLHAVFAACSSYAGRATINEANNQGSSGYIEVKILDSSITAAIWSTWSLRVCDSSGACASFSLNNATNNLPWLVLYGTVNNYIDFRNGFDARLIGANGNTIDYLSVNGITTQADGACALPYPTSISGTGSSTKTIARIPDGTGSWTEPGPGNSVKPTPGGSNVVPPGGGTPLTITVSNVSVNKGQNAVFTFTIPGSVSYDISFNYQTQNISALAGTDYTATSGVATITAGNTSTTVTVPTSAASTSGQVTFYLVISNVQNADINNYYPIGTILANIFNLHHVELTHVNDALTCEPTTVQIRACANASCSSLYTGAVTMTLSPSGWVGGNSIAFSGGSVSAQLQHTSTGSLAIAVTSLSPSPNSATTCYNSSTATNNCNITFHDSGFTYAIPDQTSCQTSASVTINAVRLDDTTQRCVPSFVSQTRNLRFSLIYSNPTSGTRPLSLSINSGTYTVTGAGVSIPVAFNGSGQASFTLSYADAGQISLNAQYTGSAGTGDAGLIMTGSTSFVTRPAKLYVYSDDANSDCTSAAPTCSAFVRAGAPFNLKVRAACADNSVTPNFLLSGLTLTHTNVAPAISQGNLGVSSFDMSAADLGQHVIGNESVSEVGAFTFTAVLPASGYFGQAIGSTALNTSAIIGRFYPSHFCATAGVLSNRTDTHTASGCTDNFSYLDEQFTLATTLTAQAFGSACNASGLTRNYSGAWSQFSNPFVDNTAVGNDPGKWNYAAVNNPGGTPVDLSARLLIDTATSTGSFSNGQASLSTQLKVIRSGSAPGYTAETPFANVHIGINPVDNDNVSLGNPNLTIGTQTYFDAGNSALYFGRLIADNAYGSDDPATPLDMYAHTEYCAVVNGGTCSSWQAKPDDSCSIYNVLPPSSTALGAITANDGAGGYYQRASATVSSGVFDFNDVGTAPSYARVFVPDTSGHSAGWRLFYTGSGNGGDYTIPFYFPFNGNTGEHPYLLHQDGVASFGQFRGDDRIIYWREILE